MIDIDGFRPNVGIVLINQNNCVFWAKRRGQTDWQFPQGGVRWNEQPAQALYRELREETGLQAKDVELLGSTRGWRYYRTPVRKPNIFQPVFLGQKQKWYLLRLIGKDSAIQLNAGHQRPEFDAWRWENYWLPCQDITFFKRLLYIQVLHELHGLYF